jgi:hypothetical protein
MKHTIVMYEQRHTTETGETSESSKCTFSGVIPIDLKRFTASSVAVVECLDCSRTRSLSPSKEGVIRFPPHELRKRQTPVTSKRWATKGPMDWDVVGCKMMA